MKTALGRDVDSATECVLKVSHKPARKPRRRLWPDINQQVEVAVRTGRASCYRSEDTDVRSTVLGRDPEDLAASFEDRLLRRHLKGERTTRSRQPEAGRRRRRRIAKPAQRGRGASSRFGSDRRFSVLVLSTPAP